MHTCPVCGSQDIARVALGDPFTGQFERGETRFDGCRNCAYWQELIALRDTTLESEDGWHLLMHGQGAFAGLDEMRAVSWPVKYDRAGDVPERRFKPTERFWGKGAGLP